MRSSVYACRFDTGGRFFIRPDPHNKELAFNKILKEIMLQRRRDELALYKLFAGDPAFNASWTQSMQRMVARQ